MLEISVLNTGLDHIEGRGNDQRGASTTHRGDKVLGPRGLVVVLEGVDVFLGESRATKELEKDERESVCRPFTGRYGGK